MSLREYLRNRPKSQEEKEWAKMEREMKRKARRPVTLEEAQETYRSRMKLLKMLEEAEKKDKLK